MFAKAARAPENTNTRAGGRAPRARELSESGQRRAAPPRAARPGRGPGPGRREETIYRSRSPGSFMFTHTLISNVCILTPCSWALFCLIVGQRFHVRRVAMCTLHTSVSIGIGDGARVD